MVNPIENLKSLSRLADKHSYGDKGYGSPPGGDSDLVKHHAIGEILHNAAAGVAGLYGSKELEADHRSSADLHRKHKEFYSKRSEPVAKPVGPVARG